MAEPRRKAGLSPHAKHAAFYIGLGAGLIVFFLCLWGAPRYAFAAGTNTLFLVYLLLTGVRLPRLTPDVLRRHADDSDLPAWLILGVVVVAAGLSIFELFRALNGDGPPALQAVVIGVISVVLGWFTIHTMAALHYAFEYYQSGHEPGAGRSKSVRGLNFPDGNQPTGIAFLYFAYAIGTSNAVSDVTVTSDGMRKLVMLHSVFSFFFNTLIVAAMVNVAVAVGAG